MASPSDRAKDDFAYFISRMREHEGGDAADALAYHHEALLHTMTTVVPANDRRSTDMVLKPNDDGSFGPHNRNERDGTFYIGWDLGAGADETVVVIMRNGCVTATLDVDEFVQGEIGTITGFTITETKKR